MNSRSDQRQLKALRDYATGLLRTRRAIERAGVEDYAKLVIALVQHDLDLPKPADTPARASSTALRVSAVASPSSNSSAARVARLVDPRTRPAGLPDWPF